jgi:hypothetical protein
MTDFPRKSAFFGKNKYGVSIVKSRVAAAGRAEVWVMLCKRRGRKAMVDG